MSTAVSALPQLFAALSLVDPVINPPELDTTSHVSARVAAALVRRDLWASREEAHASFAKKANFFGKWPEECLRRYVEFCLVDQRTFGAEDEGVELKTRKIDEAVGFLSLCLSLFVSYH
jgi:hypothetical protein